MINEFIDMLTIYILGPPSPSVFELSCGCFKSVRMVYIPIHTYTNNAYIDM